MIFVDFNGVIESEREAAFDWEATEFQSVSRLRQILRDHPEDPDICLNIDCDGGSVEEGFKIYDELRNSGKNVYTNINGSCHSMAVVVLLAAPYANRSANRNSRALIHRVYSCIWGMLTTDDASQLADALKVEEDAILDLYSDRTGKTVEELRGIMHQERSHTAQDLLEMGFISKINAYNTNQFFHKSFNMATKSNTFESFMQKMKALKNKYSSQPMNYDYLDADGNVVLSTEGDEDNLAVGVAATLSSGEPSGTVTLEDGRVVTVTDNVVTEIQVPTDNPEEDLNERVAELEALLQDAANLAQEQQDTINQLQEQLNNHTGSNYAPKPRRANVPNKENKTPELTVEELKAQARESQNKVNAAKNIRRA